MSDQLSWGWVHPWPRTCSAKTRLGQANACCLGCAGWFVRCFRRLGYSGVGFRGSMGDESHLIHTHKCIYLVGAEEVPIPDGLAPRRGLGQELCCC